MFLFIDRNVVLKSLFVLYLIFQISGLGNRVSQNALQNRFEALSGGNVEIVCDAVSLP